MAPHPEAAKADSQPATAIFLGFESQVGCAIEALRTKLKEASPFSQDTARTLAIELNQSAARIGATIESLAELVLEAGEART